MRTTPRPGRPTSPRRLRPAPPPDVNVYKLDASAQGGAVRLTDLHGFNTGNLHAAGGLLFFQHTDGPGIAPPVDNGALWVSDGTAAVTHAVFTFTGDQHPDFV